MIDDVFAVIADPTRRQILRVLSSGKRPVGDLVNELGVSQPTVSKHLKVLRTAGLVETQAAGQKRFYSLTPEPLTQISAWVESLNQALEQTANPPISAEETPASHQPQQQEELQPLDSPQQQEDTQPVEQPQEVLEPAVATFDLGQEGGSTAPAQPRHSQRAIAFTPLKPFAPKIATAEATVDSEQVTALEQVIEELEPAEDNSATQSAAAEEVTSAPEQTAYEPLPSLPPAPENEQESEQRGLLATLSRWGRRRSR